MGEWAVLELTGTLREVVAKGGSTVVVFRLFENEKIN